MEDHHMVYSTREYEGAAYASMPTKAAANVKEAVGIFMSYEDLQKAIRELEGTAFPRQDISVMGTRADLEKAFGSKTVSPQYAMGHADTPRQAPSRPEEQTIGAAGVIGGTAYVGAMALALTAGAVTFPAIISAAVIGGISGGTIGAILTKILGGRYNRHIEEQIENGGLLLWVRTPDSHKEDIARQIMVSNSAYGVHIHRM